MIETGISPINSYNSVSQLLKIDGFKGLFSLIGGSYQYFFQYCINPSIYNEKMMGTLTIVLFAYTIYTLGYIIIKKKVNYLNVIFVILCCILLPLGGNIIYVLTNGTEHNLMIFSFFVFIVWVICLREYRLRIEKTVMKDRIPGGDTLIIYGFCLLFIINSTIYANQIYLKKDLEFRNTYATLNRVIDRIEQIDDYIVNETPVAFIGSLEESDLAVKQEYFSYDGPGLGGMFATTYYSTYNNYLKSIMNYPIYLLDYDSASALADDDRVKEMNVFPNSDSCKMIDGTMVVKFSDLE